MSFPWLELRVPLRCEFSVRKAWLADPEFMSYNAGWDLKFPGYDPVTGCVDWPEVHWDVFEERLRLPAEERAYFYVFDSRIGEPIGHVYYTVEDGVSSIGLNVIPTRRGKGLGTAFLELLLTRIREDTTATEVTNEFEDERLAARRLHQKAGFRPDPRTDVGYGRPTRTWRLRVERGTSWN